MKYALCPLILALDGCLRRIFRELLVVRPAHVGLLGLLVLGEVGLVGEQLVGALLLPLLVDEHGESAGEVRELEVGADLVNFGLLSLGENLIHTSTIAQLPFLIIY